MTRRTTYSALALALLLGACESPVSTPDPQEAPATLTLSVDWAALDRVASASVPAANGAALLVGEVPNDPYPVNRVGVRVVYHGIDAVFVQTVDRNTAERTGIITLTLPPADGAKLYVLAVHEPEPDKQNEREVAKAMAFSDLGRLIPGRALKLTTSSLIMSPITWSFKAPIQSTDVGDLRLGAILSTDAQSYMARAEVTDLFGDVPVRFGSTRRYLEFNGTGGFGLLAANKREILIPVGRNGKAAGEKSSEDFYPYVNGNPFNLGDQGRFAVLPFGRVEVTWAAGATPP